MCHHKTLDGEVASFFFEMTGDPRRGERPRHPPPEAENRSLPSVVLYYLSEPPMLRHRSRALSAKKRNVVA
jgi:hypothetical protein